MKICVIGTGYVGLVAGACLANCGHTLYCVDINKKKIDSLNKGQITIYEPYLGYIVKRNTKNKRLNFTLDIKKAVQTCDIVYIAVGTPMADDGSANLKYVFAAAASIGQYMNKHTYIVDKSTVPVGTAKKVKAIIQKELDKRKSKLTFDVISNPEFLKEGNAVLDYAYPDRIVIGCDSLQAKETMKNLYQPLLKKKKNCLIFMDLASAEMTKYAANAMLATKISFMNEIANICVHVGADVNKVRLGIGSDKRIGFSFISPGCGYGGSCFPKDVNALIKTSEENDYDATLLKAVDSINNRQKKTLIKMITRRFGKQLKNKTFAIWGLAFKPNTDDMHEATSIVVINELTKLGANVRVFDPKAMEAAKERYFKDNNKITYCNNKDESLEKADAIVVLTEWDIFREPSFKHIKRKLKTPIIFDGRNIYNEEKLNKLGFEYYQIGVKR